MQLYVFAPPYFLAFQGSQNMSFFFASIYLYIYIYKFIKFQRPRRKCGVYIGTATWRRVHANGPTSSCACRSARCRRPNGGLRGSGTAPSGGLRGGRALGALRARRALRGLVEGVVVRMFGRCAGTYPCLAFFFFGICMGPPKINLNSINTTIFFREPLKDFPPPPSQLGHDEIVAEIQNGRWYRSMCTTCRDCIERILFESLEYSTSEMRNR